jgi:hypothetical protein
VSQLTTGSDFPQLPARSLARGAGAWATTPSPTPRSALPLISGLTPGQSPKWAWRGAHSGAGVTTLARELGGADLGTTSRTGLPTLVVCRSSAAGLIAAQRLASSELAGAPTWTCLGLVVVADGPGPLAKSLAELTALILGGYPDHWPIPWMESWQTLPSSPWSTVANRPNRIARLLRSSIHPVIQPAIQPKQEHL